MVQILKAIRGMNDILPKEAGYWQQLEDACRQTLHQYGYQQIRFPIVEQTQLFKRSVGEATDIVEKEMYTFADRNGDSLSLRPEGTAGCVRAGIEHGLLYNQTQRFWYMGPMFRHERPQKGRYRQFHQFGAEAFGMAGPAIDAELILMTWRLWHALGLSEQVTLELNSLGTAATRDVYRQTLVDYLMAYSQHLDEDSLRRLETNPLRILDSKNPALESIIANAPHPLDYLDDAAKQHFQQLCDLLEQANVPYTVNPNLVRGLDYYSLTVFEWVTDQLGSQAAVCSGGRYDSLVATLGGKSTPAVGFAGGMERLILLLQQQQVVSLQPDIVGLYVSEAAQALGLCLAEKIHDAVSDVVIENYLSLGSLKNQMKRAAKSGARWALIIADDEVANQQVTIRDLKHQQQRLLTIPEAIRFFVAVKKNDEPEHLLFTE